MMRLLARGPVLMSIFPFNNNNNYFDKPVKEVVKPLIEDEMGWDRVKRIFQVNKDGTLTKELQSIINLTISSLVIGAIIGGIGATKDTVNNFIANNEATKFINHFDAKKHLQQIVVQNFIKKGSRMAGKLSLFCCMFGTVATCTTAYRGKLTAGNYILGGSTAGLLYKMNLGPRAALVGAGLGGILGAIYGNLTISILYLAGVSMNEVLEVQYNWVNSRDENLHKRINAAMSKKDDSEVKILYEENLKLKKQTRNTEDHNT